jgi:hypothetical protein
MKEYRLLFFNNGVLDRWDSVEAPSDIAAVEEAAGRGRRLTVEVWRKHRRLATIRASPPHRA